MNFNEIPSSTLKQYENLTSKLMKIKYYNDNEYEK